MSDVGIACIERAVLAGEFALNKGPGRSGRLFSRRCRIFLNLASIGWQIAAGCQRQLTGWVSSLLRAARPQSELAGRDGGPVPIILLQSFTHELDDEIAERHGLSSATFYAWKAKYGGLEISEAKRLRALEDENAKLKRLLVDAMLDNAGLKEPLSKKW